MTIVGLARIALALVLALAVQFAWCADRRVTIVHEETAVARQAVELLVAELGRLGLASDGIARIAVETEGFDAARYRAQPGTVAVAVGPKTLRPALQLAAGKPVVALLVSRATVEDIVPAPERMAAIVLDQPADRILNLVQVALAGVRQLGILASPVSQRSVRLLEKRAQDRHLVLNVESIGSSDDVVGGIERLAPRIKALVALPDPVVHNRNTVQPLLLTTYRARLPVVGYSESYLQAGAALALYSTPAQIAQQAAETIAQALEGRTPVGIESPRYFMVGVNGAVARSLGLAMPTMTELQERLRALE